MLVLILSYGMASTCLFFAFSVQVGAERCVLISSLKYIRMILNILIIFKLYDITRIDRELA